MSGVVKRGVQVWVKAPRVDANAGKTDMDGKPLKPRWIPDIYRDPTDRNSIGIDPDIYFDATPFKDQTGWWMVGFEYPTSEDRQERIRKACRQLKQAGKLFTCRKDLPRTLVDVKRSVEDRTKPKIDGEWQRKEVTEQEEVQRLAYDLSFANKADPDDVTDISARKVAVAVGRVGRGVS